jgi:TRAP-type C4-dicarboxylate transport system substrate-binding protein
MRATRRSLITAALATPLLPRFAQAAEFSLRVAHTAPLRFPLHIRLTEAAEQIAKESNGQVELQIFPDSQLGGDNDTCCRRPAVARWISVNRPGRSWPASCR